MKIQNTWPTHKARARGRNARHRAMIRAQRRTGQAAQVPRTVDAPARRHPWSDSTGADGATR
ncbi:hypothetical protein [Tsukamurella tyrosinosolvens]|uniref:hypothetical protein n=1 Tax=Tsukamurella tyrosinosolvens TaxID=57704 RepID=UPI000CA3D90F|nr:hypothetical protein [Tsukamurella tyrosinosolvens]AUN40921.1 hypothetical protein ASU32_13650 [Tsukamurella tyrosinosolvens]